MSDYKKNTDLIKLAVSDIEYRWETDRYDGNLAGTLLWKGELFYYHCCDQSEYGCKDWYRRFELFKLSVEEKTLLENMERDFNLYVDGKSKESWDQFYLKYPEDVEETFWKDKPAVAILED